ncbi:MAG: hypothetical protein ACYCX9_12555 [Candidatus Dormibacteria bacterium]|jgi:hypothetical protein
MLDPESPREEQSVTTVSQAPGTAQRSTYTASTPVTTTGFKLRQLVWLAAGVVDAILALDFIFRLIGANAIGFVAFIGNLAAALSAPFRGILASTATAGAHVAYWPDVVAIVVYGIAAWIVVALIGIMATPRATRPARL